MSKGAGIVPIRFHENHTHILLLKGTSGKWGFPKGQKEKNEDLKQTAIRETLEETGIHVSRDKLKTSFTVGDYKFWFVNFDDLKDVKIQQSEISEYKWMELEDFVKLDVKMKNYPAKIFGFMIEREKWPIYHYIRDNERRKQNILEPSP